VHPADGGVVVGIGVDRTDGAVPSDQRLSGFDRVDGTFAAAAEVDELGSGTHWVTDLTDESCQPNRVGPKPVETLD